MNVIEKSQKEMKIFKLVEELKKLCMSFRTCFGILHMRNRPFIPLSRGDAIGEMPQKVWKDMVNVGHLKTKNKQMI